MLLLVLLTNCVAMGISLGDTSKDKRLLLSNDEDVSVTIQAMSAQILLLNGTVHTLIRQSQAKESAIQSLEASIQSRDTTIHSLEATIHSLNTTVEILQTTIKSMDSTMQFMQTTMQSQQTTLQSVQTSGQTTENNFQSLQTTLQTLETKFATVQGSTYTRWGRTTCATNGTELVYKGFVGGSHWGNAGSAADYICLTEEPLWGHYETASSSSSNLPKVYGAEYQFHYQFGDGGEAMFGQDLHDHDVPCAVCRPQRTTTLMIPGRNRCYTGWTLEYWGYLVSGIDRENDTSNYACLDAQAEVEFGDTDNDDGAMMYVTQAACGSLTCPPYVEGRQITCVVCSI